MEKNLRIKKTFYCEYYLFLETFFMQTKFVNRELVEVFSIFHYFKNGNNGNTPKIYCFLILVRHLHVGLLTDLFRELQIKINNNASSTGQFEWVDGILVTSLKEGHWLLIQNVNFCRFD